MTYLVEPKDEFYRVAKLVRVIDGDTLFLDIDLGWGIHIQHSVRLSRCDTPEKNRISERPAGEWVTERVRSWLNGVEQVKIHSLKFSADKYDRCIAEVWANGLNLATWLLYERYAWPTDEQGKIVGKRDIDRLSGIPKDVRKKVGG